MAPLNPYRQSVEHKEVFTNLRNDTRDLLTRISGMTAMLGGELVVITDALEAIGTTDAKASLEQIASGLDGLQAALYIASDGAIEAEG